VKKSLRLVISCLAAEWGLGRYVLGDDITDLSVLSAVVGGQHGGREHPQQLEDHGHSGSRGGRTAGVVRRVSRQSSRLLLPPSEQGRVGVGAVVSRRVDEHVLAVYDGPVRERSYNVASPLQQPLPVSWVRGRRHIHGDLGWRVQLGKSAVEALAQDRSTATAGTRHRGGYPRPTLADADLVASVNR
jgi:hypothetical protein